jgi:FkbM family methyltransferase
MSQVKAAIRKLVRVLPNRTWRDALVKHGVAASVEHRLMLGSLEPIRCLVDIGANRGQFALAAHRYFPAARIISFEPLPGPADVFRRVFSSSREVTLHQAAVGASAGKATMHVAARDDSSSLLPIGQLQNRLFPNTSEVMTMEVSVGELSDFIGADDIAPPALLKIDVQGFELQVLQGCATLLNRFAIVYVECSFIELYEGQALADEVLSWLHARGFSLFGTYNMSYDSHGACVQADLLFRRAAV